MHLIVAEPFASKVANLSSLVKLFDRRLSPVLLTHSSLSPLKPVVRIQNNLEEIVTGLPSAKKAKTDFDPSTNEATRGRRQFPLCTYGKTLKIFTSETSGRK